jgi:alpha-ribazole phosphatase
LLARALQALRPDLAFHPDPRLAEMDFGHWEGRRWDALGEPALTAWTNDFAHHPPGGGESVQAFMTRVASAWRDAHRSGGSCAWITHAGVIRATALLEQGITTPTRADQWPAAVPGFGEWRVRTARQGTASHLETHPAGGARRNAGK